MKDFDEFESYAESDAFREDLETLRKQMEARYDSKPELAGDGEDMRALVIDRWVEQRRPLLLLRKYHEWLNS